MEDLFFRRYKHGDVKITVKNDKLKETLKREIENFKHLGFDIVTEHNIAWRLPDMCEWEDGDETYRSYYTGPKIDSDTENTYYTWEQHISVEHNFAYHPKVVNLWEYARGFRDNLLAHGKAMVNLTKDTKSPYTLRESYKLFILIPRSDIPASRVHVTECDVHFIAVDLYDRGEKLQLRPKWSSPIEISIS